MIQNSLLLNIIETKLLEQYSDYCPQSEYNSTFVRYLYRYLKDNTYSGKHYGLLQDLLLLKDIQPTLTVKEKTDKSTYVITDDVIGISDSLFVEITNIVKKYNNYNFVVKSKNRIVVSVKFGWLPPNAGSWLNLLSNDNLIDYYIDGITLRPNVHTKYLNGAPDSGYVCYRLDSISEYNTIMFLINNVDNVDISDITFATLLIDIEGSKGATLNRIIKTTAENAFYELGPYNQNYLSTYVSSLIIQVPYSIAMQYENLFYVFDVSNSVQINNKNNAEDLNSSDNWYVSFTDANYSTKFIKNTINLDKIPLILQSQEELLDKILIRYVLGDFIWLTSDSKLIAYAQNLINAYAQEKITVSDGVWNDNLSNYIKNFKSKSNIVTLFDDDVLDIITEELIVTLYKNREHNRYNVDVDTNKFFNEW